ncbi:MAG: family 43 glycosylhydrolase [Proteobacteria bacterium]|nr:family 43 glycosylhydrolase [Pseudomonadota bacterium]
MEYAGIDHSSCAAQGMGSRMMRGARTACAAVLIGLLVSACGGSGGGGGDDDGPPPAARPANLPLEAHDGMILQDGDTYILYGTTYACGFALGVPGTPWCGVRAYTSKDLVDWRDAGLMFDPAAWQTRCAPATSYGCYRPHVQRRADGTWVMWLNVSDYENTGYAVLTANSSLGPWTEQPRRAQLSVHLGGQLPYGDHDIRIGPDGTGWAAYTVIDTADGNLHDLVVEKLNTSLTAGTGELVRFGLTAAEAPAISYREGTWYLTYSDPMCAYCGGTGTSYQTAPTPLGPWTYRGKITEVSCNGQPAAINPLTIDGRPVWLYQSDVWNQLAPGQANPNQAKAVTHLEPLRFAEDGRLLPVLCTDTY